MNSRSVLHNARHGRAARAGSTVLVGLLLMLIGPSAALAQPIPQPGVVGMRALYQNEDGQHVYVAYDENGKFVRELMPKTDGLRVMSGSAYRAILANFRSVRNDTPETIRRGATLKTREEFAGWTPEPVEVWDKENQHYKEVPVPKGTIRNDTTRSVWVRSEESVSHPALLPEDRGLILFEAPIDLLQATTTGIGDKTRSLILNEQGQVVEESEHRIGLKTRYLSDTGIEDEPDLFRYNPLEDELAKPVRNALVAGNNWNRYDTTDDRGRYAVNIEAAPCYLYDEHRSFEVVAWLRYRTFDPQDPDSADRRMFRGRGGYRCISNSSVSFAGPVPQILPGENRYELDRLHVPIPIDAVALAGKGALINPAAGEESRGSVVSVSEDATRYDHNVPDYSTYRDPRALAFDFDGGGQTDWVSDPSADGTVGVYLDGEPEDPDNPGEPDMQRLADYEPDFADRGLLQRISIEDLKNTDIYVFRTATGEMLAEKNGLTEAEVQPGENRFTFSLFLPGRPGNIVSAPGEVPWGGKHVQLNESLIGNDVDTLREGEHVRLVAINRPTGYIGTLETQLDAAGDQGRIDFDLDDLHLAPPNLKVRVERVYQVWQGAQPDPGTPDGSRRESLIGFEGSGRTNDIRVEIRTDWRDRDGNPLPENLPGYTGRLAKVVGDRTLATVSGGNAQGEDERATDGYAVFEIRPGYRLQVLKLKGDIQTTEHFYVQVAGRKFEQPADFFSPDGNAAGEGVLAQRPMYTPIRVPIYDEAATQNARNAAGGYDRDLSGFEATYRWPYRPEMQFTMLDLMIRDVMTEEGGDLPSLIGQDSVSALWGADGLQLEFQLTENGYQALPFIGPGKTLLFSLGGYEVEATLNCTEIGNGVRNCTVQFSDLSFLDQLDPSSTLALSLLQNEDANNALWEWELGSGNFNIRHHSLAKDNREIRSKMPDNHFYPVLGLKKLFVEGRHMASGDYGTEDRVVVTGVKPAVEGLEVHPGVCPAAASADSLPAECAEEAAAFEDGYAKLLLGGGRSVKPVDDEDGRPRPIKLELRMFPADSGPGNTTPFSTSTEIIIKTAGNTSLKEVLGGKAVWAYSFDADDDDLSDGNTTDYYIGKTTGAEPEEQGFDYAQYLMNMVTIPLVTPVRESNLQYAIKPDGFFGGDAESMLEVLMYDPEKEDRAQPDIPEYDDSDETGNDIASEFGGVISHHDYDHSDDDHRDKPLRTFRKLLQDYQPFGTQTDEKTYTVDADRRGWKPGGDGFHVPPGLDREVMRKRIITPEVMRGKQLDIQPNAWSGEALTDSEAGSEPEFVSDDLGLYELYYHYDWDGDGISNLAEVENATQSFGTSTGPSQDVFDALNSQDTALAEALKRSYSRGNPTVQPTNEDATGVITPKSASLGLGEISDSLTGGAVSGLRLPTFAPGLYDFPNSSGDLNRDAYTTPRVLRFLESAGRAWASTEIDTYPLENKPAIHARGADPAWEGNLRFGVNDISPRGGGVNGVSKADMERIGLRYGRQIPNYFLMHASHQNGLDLDMRYVSVRNWEERVIGGSQLEDTDRTISLLDKMQDKSAQFGGISLVIVGSDYSNGEIARIIEVVGTSQVAKNSSHDDHIHVRFSRESDASPRMPQTLDNRSLAYIPVDESMDQTSKAKAIEDSTHLLKYNVKDGVGQPLLPFTRMIFVVKDDDLTEESDSNGVIAVNSTHPVDNGKLWANFRNREETAGLIELRVRCLSEGDSSIALKDPVTYNVLSTISVSCELTQ